MHVAGVEAHAVSAPALIKNSVTTAVAVAVAVAVAFALIAFFFLMPTLVDFLRPKLGQAKPEGLWIAYVATGFFLLLLLPEPLRRARFLASRKENSHGERRKRRKRVRTSDSPPSE